MRTNSTSSMGAFHPAVFLLLVYAVSLFMSLFVCRIVYYSMSERSADFSGGVSGYVKQVTALK